MAENLYTTQTPASHESDDLIARNAGRRLQFAANGSITGWRLWIANTLPETELKWQLWDNSTNTKLAEVNVLALSPATGGWASGTLATPVAVTSTGDYTVSGYTIGTPGDWVYTSGTGSITNGNLTSTTGRYRGGGTNAQHPNVDDTASFFADVQFTTGNPRAVTGRATAYAGATSVVAKKAPVVGRAVGLALPTMVNPSARPVTGRCIGIAIARNRPSTEQPGGGTIARPNTGLVVRPYTGVVPH